MNRRHGHCGCVLCGPLNLGSDHCELDSSHSSLKPAITATKGKVASAYSRSLWCALLTSGQHKVLVMSHDGGVSTISQLLHYWRERGTALLPSCCVQPGDVVLLGSDGLFDNLWDDDLCDVVEAHLEVGFPWQETAFVSIAWLLSHRIQVTFLTRLRLAVPGEGSWSSGSLPPP